MCENPPDWAIERAQTLINAACIPGEHYTFGAERAFAKFIAEHEEPPVDPLLIEARKIVVQLNAEAGCEMFADKVENGLRDDHIEIRTALAALRRGIEIERERR